MTLKVLAGLGGLMNQKTELFLETFNRLEAALKKQLGKSRYTPFSVLLKEASSKDSFIRMHRSILESFSDLRNVMVHKEGSEIIAIPSDEALTRLQTITDKYTVVRTVYDVCHKQVVTTSASKTLHHAIKLMKRHDYTKIPVYEGQTYKGLLSGNVVTRWLTGHISDQGEMCENLQQIHVSQVLEAVNKSNQVQFIPKDLPVFEFISRSQRRPAKSGVYIITNKGGSNEKPLGILTPYDYERILEGLVI